MTNSEELCKLCGTKPRDTRFRSEYCSDCRKAILRENFHKHKEKVLTERQKKIREAAKKSSDASYARVQEKVSELYRRGGDPEVTLRVMIEERGWDPDFIIGMTQKLLKIRVKSERVLYGKKAVIKRRVVVG